VDCAGLVRVESVRLAKIAAMDAKDGSQETTEGGRRRAGKGVGARGEFVQGVLDLVLFSEIGNRKWVRMSDGFGYSDARTREDGDGDGLPGLGADFFFACEFVCI